MAIIPLLIGLGLIVVFGRIWLLDAVAQMAQPKSKQAGPRWYETLNWEHVLGGAFALLMLIGLFFYARVMLDPKVAAENEAYQQMRYRSNLRAQRDTAIRAGAEAAVSGDVRTLLEMDKKVRQIEEKLKQ